MKNFDEWNDINESVIGVGRIMTWRGDLVFENETEQTDKFLTLLQELIEVFQLEIIGLWPVGSGGGWPEIAFRGKEEDLVKFCIWYSGEDEGDDYEAAIELIGPDEGSGPLNVLSDNRFSTKGKREFIDDSGYAVK